MIQRINVIIVLLFTFLLNFQNIHAAAPAPKEDLALATRTKKTVYYEGDAAEYIPAKQDAQKALNALQKKPAPLAAMPDYNKTAPMAALNAKKRVRFTDDPANPTDHTDAKDLLQDSNPMPALALTKLNNAKSIPAAAAALPPLMRTRRTPGGSRLARLYAREFPQGYEQEWKEKRERFFPFQLVAETTMRYSYRESGQNASEVYKLITPEDENQKFSTLKEFIKEHASDAANDDTVEATIANMPSQAVVEPHSRHVVNVFDANGRKLYTLSPTDMIDFATLVSGKKFLKKMLTTSKPREIATSRSKTFSTAHIWNFQHHNRLIKYMNEASFTPEQAMLMHCLALHKSDVRKSASTIIDFAYRLSAYYKTKITAGDLASTLATLNPTIRRNLLPHCKIYLRETRIDGVKDHWRSYEKWKEAFSIFKAATKIDAAHEDAFQNIEDIFEDYILAEQPAIEDIDHNDNNSHLAKLYRQTLPGSPDVSAGVNSVAALRLLVPLDLQELDGSADIRWGKDANSKLCFRAFQVDISESGSMALSIGNNAGTRFARTDEHYCAINIYDSSTRKKTLTLPYNGMRNIQPCAAWSPCDNFIAACAIEDRNHRKILIWNARNGNLVRTIENCGSIFFAAWHPDGNHLIVTTNEQRNNVINQYTYLWNIQTGERMNEIPHNSLTGCPTWNHDGSQLVTITESYRKRMLRWWDFSHLKSPLFLSQYRNLKYRTLKTEQMMLICLFVKFCAQNEEKKGSLPDVALCANIPNVTGQEIAAELKRVFFTLHPAIQKTLLSRFNISLENDCLVPEREPQKAVVKKVLGGEQVIRNQDPI